MSKLPEQRIPTGEKSSYDPTYFASLYAVEDKHFWFKTRNYIIYQLAKQLTSKLPPNPSILEVGCGTGNVLRFLERTSLKGQVVGMDLFADSLDYARQRVSCSLVQADLMQPPFPACFHLIGMFDVLEHLPDDLQVLEAVKAMLVPGGSLMLTVPAHMTLWSYFDEEARHCRRYAPQQLREQLLKVGYRIEYLSQYMMSAFPLVWISRRLSNKYGKAKQSVSRELSIMPGINTVLAAILMLEAQWIRNQHSLPIGTSLIAIARKAEES